MPIDPRKRQKKQERHAAKRKSKQHQLGKQKHTGLAERLTTAARYPVLHSWVTEDFWTEGIGWVCLSRQLPNHFVAFAVFLVDRYCLGVKDVLADIVIQFEYERQIVRKMQSTFASREMKPADVRKLVESAVAYAESLGLHPHHDYFKVRQIFGDIDASQSAEQFEFGKDGKPFFVGGPNDTPERSLQIVKTLKRHCGPGGFEYLVPIPERTNVIPGSAALPEDEDTGPDNGRNARGDRGPAQT